jgi:hypothetical protein
MNCLREYKKSILNLGENIQQKKFLENSFARWYFNCKKRDIFPLENIVSVQDLEYANLHKTTRFNIDKFIKRSTKIFDIYFVKITAACLDFGDKMDYGNSYYKAITPKQFGRLQDTYTGDNKYFYQTIDKLISIYELIGINNVHLSIPPIFKGIELFGSPLNTHNKEYCSPFKIERQFGSMGSFWDYKFHRNGIYLCNPPFDERFINKMTHKLLADISDTDYKVLIIITIPLWDSNSQQTNDVQNYGLELEGLTMLLKSPYLTDHKILNKEEFPYWNYYTEEVLPVCWTHLLILSNLNSIFYKKNFSTNYFLNLWKNFVATNPNKVKPL